MKYEMYAGRMLYLPESERESVLVREHLRGMLDLVGERKYLLWDREQSRNRCWYPASILLPQVRPSDGSRYVFIIDCALPVGFVEDPFLETRWSHQLKEDVDREDFLGILRAELEITSKGVHEADLIKTVSRLFKKHAARSKR